MITPSGVLGKMEPPSGPSTVTRPPKGCSLQPRPFPHLRTKPPIYSGSAGIVLIDGVVRRLQSE